MSLRKDLFYYAINTFGWKTKRRIIVFESDDWGGVRIPDKQAYNHLLNKGITVDLCPYSKYDGFETKEDIEGLVNVLNEVRDHKNSVPCFTLNFNTANPNFQLIKSNNFESYFFETFIETYRRYNNGAEKSLQQSIQSKFFNPQYHGREHMNIFMWLDLLRENDHIRYAFDFDCYALGYNNSKTIQLPYLASYAPYEGVSIDQYSEILKSGLDIFKNEFLFEADSFIGPVYFYDRKIEDSLNNFGIKAIQGLFMHTLPGENRRHYRLFKQRNRLNQLQLVRNCFFEPSTNHTRDWVSQCFNEIRIAFNCGKPAIICSHRLNYMGGLILENRDRNLLLLSQLLKRIVTEWGDVEFMSSSDLTALINDEQ